MIVQGEPIGGFFAAWFEKEHRCTPAELRLVDGISRQAGIALANARLVEELKARQSRLEALLRVSHELARIQPVESLLGGIAKTSGQLFGANAVTFHLVEGEELVLRGNWNEAEDFMASPRLRIGQSLTGSVVTSGELLVVQDPADDARMAPAHRENYRRQGVRAFLAAPVKIDDKVIGVLGIRTCQVEGFSKADVEMARALASQAAIALENSRLYQEVQRAFDELSPTKDQLVQAQKMDAIGQLAGGIAHDFNNILTVIGGRSQLLLARVAADDRARPDIQLIAHASERATALTRQLLAFSRKQVLEPRALDLNVLAGGLAPMLSRLIGAHIELLIAPGARIGQVMADPGQLEQVIMNLVVNARDAMPEGGTVRIETGSVDLPDGAKHAQGQIPPGAVCDPHRATIPDVAYTRPPSQRSSSPSSPRRSPAKAPASVCRPSTASSVRATDSSGWTARWVKAPSSPCTCPPHPHGGGNAGHPGEPRAHRVRARDDSGGRGFRRDAPPDLGRRETEGYTVLETGDLWRR